MDRQLDQLNVMLAEAVGPAAQSETNGLIRRHYSISWSGLIPRQASNVLIGQLKAWPCVGRRPGDGLMHRYFVGLVRARAWGEYQPGDSWDTRPPPGCPSLTREWALDPANFHDLAHEIITGLAWMIDTLEDAFAGREVPVCTPTLLVALDLRTGNLIEPDQLNHVAWKDRYAPLQAGDVRRTAEQK